MLRRLRFKFVLTNMAIVTIMLCSIFGLIYHFTAQSLERVSVTMMKSVAERPFHRDPPGGSSPNVNLPYFSLQISKHGELIATGGGFYDLSDEDYLDTLIAAVDATGEQTGTLKDYSLRFFRSDNHGDTCIVFADTSNERSTLKNMLEIFLLIGGLSFLAFLGISLLLARWEVKPVEQAWQLQRQFVADASHELKTPLTVILTNAELLQSEDEDAESRRQFSGSILTMARQMRGLVEQLLELARSDSSQSQPVFSAVDLSGLAADAVLPFEPVFYERGLSLKTEIEPELWVSGGEAQLRQVVDILLDNACKYSRPDGSVTVALRRLNRAHCLLTVANTGEPIPAQDLDRIFRRFYRVDKARTGSDSGGFGLGLSIAESIVARHRGRIWAESREGVNSFKVELPTQTPEKPLLPQSNMK